MYNIPACICNCLHEKVPKSFETCRTQQKLNINLERCAFRWFVLRADDQILMATSEDELQTMAYRLNIIARKYKMIICSTKTKSMAMCREPHTEGKNCDKRQHY